MSRGRIQIRIGEYFNCIVCGTRFYAPPSRAKTIKKSGHGFCSAGHFAEFRMKLHPCPICCKPVRYPNTYCSFEHYRESKNKKEDDLC